MNDIDKKRHSLSHLLAMAILEKFPKTKLAIGPVIENGFYYDFDGIKISDEDFTGLEKKMRELIKQDLKFQKKNIKLAEAKKMFKGQPYKLELIKELKNISIYKSGNFTDLCAGPHVKSTKEISPEGFKLTHIAGAYWRGDEKNAMLTRIYGLAFETKKELDDFIKLQEEAEKHDHRKIGQQLEIFMFDDDVGQGLPLWLPKGAIIAEELENLAKETEMKAGYQRVKTPHIAKESMYKKSGHLPYYAESMFPPMELEKEKYYLKAMNCPHHHKIYASKKRSYKDLPLRLAEYGTCYRYEKSGELFGLMRVRSLNMNDAHIYCSREQFAGEFKAVNDLYLKYLKIFDIKKYVMRFSTHDPKNLGKKYVNEPKLWKETEKLVRETLIKTKIPFVEAKDEAAFYGPKIDVEIWSAVGKEFTLATNQVDFAVPKRFGLVFTNKNGKEETPLCLHRAPLSTHERLIGFLIEHYAGAFPTWLSPIQAKILPVSEKFNDYAEKVYSQLLENNIRVEINNSNETLGKKIRAAEMEKIPYILVVGEKEKKSGTVAVRERGKGDLGAVKLENFLDKIKKEIEEKK